MVNSKSTMKDSFGLCRRARFICFVISGSFVVVAETILALPFDQFSSRVAQTTISESVKSESTEEIQASSDVSADQWYRDWAMKKSRLRTLLDNPILIIKQESDLYSAVKTGTSQNAHVTFPRFPNDEQISLTMELNQQGQENRCRKNALALARCFDARFVLDVSKEQWTLFNFQRGSKSLKPVLKAIKNSNFDYAAWITNQLYFDALVLEQKDDLLLALLPKEIHGKSAEGYLVAKSRGKFWVSPDTSKQGAAVRLENSSGNLAVFRIVVENHRRPVKVGPATKIILSDRQQSPDSDPGASGPEDISELPAK